jgi:hypothetical protein
VQSELLAAQPQRVALAACSRSEVRVSASSTEQSNEAAALESERQSWEQWALQLARQQLVLPAAAEAWPVAAGQLAARRLPAACR